DGTGDLFMNGTDQTGFAPEFAELPHGSNTIATISLDNIYMSFPGGLQWKGKYLLVGAVDEVRGAYQDMDYIYQVVITGTQGAAAGIIFLYGARDVTQFSIDRTKLSAPNSGGG